MNVDKYTKVILTIIAVALLMNVFLDVSKTTPAIGGSGDFMVASGAVGDAYVVNTKTGETKHYRNNNFYDTESK